MEESLNLQENENILKADLPEGHLPSGSVDPFLLNGAALAYIGDAVYEIMVRQYMLATGSHQADRLHKHTIRMVNAGAQSDMIRALMTELTETETGIFKRGRNASTLTTARNQSVTDYRRATGLEALFGYLYLSGQQERLRELFEHGMALLKEEGGPDQRQAE